MSKIEAALGREIEQRIDPVTDRVGGRAPRSEPPEVPRVAYAIGGLSATAGHCYRRGTSPEARRQPVNSSLGAGGLAATGVGLVTIFGLTFSQVRLLAVCVLILFVVGAALVRLSYRQRKDLSEP
jgi:hypothetical protein